MYTVNEVATKSGITVRTLHYYDQIGLLKPVKIERNGYRYYNENSLLTLQQILLYKEMGIPLDEVKQIISDSNFDVLKSLEIHKEKVLQKIEQLKTLIKTIDETKIYLKGNTKMKNVQLFKGLTPKQEQEMEQDAINSYDPLTVKESFKKWNSYTKEEKERILKEGNKIYEDFISVIDKQPSSKEAQECVSRWREHMKYFWTPTEDQLLSISEGYVNDHRFKKNFDKIDSRLAEFVRDAVKIYVSKLS